MHTRTTTAAALLLAAGLTLTACSSSSGSDKPTATPTTPLAPAATTAPAYNPAAWKTRIHSLISTSLDPAQAECTTSPSSDVCANALRAADTTLLAMKQAIDTSGQAAQYPATTDHLGKILTAYNDYISGDCPGNPLADDKDSDCRMSEVTVLLGTATLTSKMILDGGTQ